MSSGSSEISRSGGSLVVRVVLVRELGGRRRGSGSEWDGGCGYGRWCLGVGVVVGIILGAWRQQQELLLAATLALRRTGHLATRHLARTWPSLRLGRAGERGLHVRVRPVKSAGS